MAYADQQMSGSRIVAIIIVALIHVALGYALVTGLAYSAFKKAVERVTTVDIEERGVALTLYVARRRDKEALDARAVGARIVDGEHVAEVELAQHGIVHV